MRACISCACFIIWPRFFMTGLRTNSGATLVKATRDASGNAPGNGAATPTSDGLAGFVGIAGLVAGPVLGRVAGRRRRGGAREVAHRLDLGARKGIEHGFDQRMGG